MLSRALTRSGIDAGITLAALLLLTVIAADAQTFQVIHNFAGGADGGDSMAGLTMDRAGNLYGTTWSGGVGYGNVFKLQHEGSGWVMKRLYSFVGGSDGAGPTARVIFGPDGNLYGTTTAGGGGSCSYFGYNGCGTVFRLQPPASVCRSVSCPWTETVLYRASEDNGAILSGEVVFDQAGNLYSTVGNGGINDGGYVFELSPSNDGFWIRTILYSFNPENGDGNAPRAGLIFDQAGNLYGTTANGGEHLDGTVFELSPSGSGWTETILHSFTYIDDGNDPQASLVFDHQGNLYGTAFDGGPNEAGVVFELSPAGGGWSFSLVWSFLETGNGGALPLGPVTFDASGNLYGATFSTGCCGAGTIFELSPSGGGWSETVLHNFNGGDGETPYSNVVLDSQGNGYGTASAGGADGHGVIWAVTP